jgi:antitoxin HicB
LAFTSFPRLAFLLSSFKTLGQVNHDTNSCWGSYSAANIGLYPGTGRHEFRRIPETTLGGREMARYTIILEPNYPQKGYTVRVPALPGCITYGKTKEEALMRAKEAIEGFIEGLGKAGEPIPEEVTPVEMGTVTV